jgi:hypothetical protein
MQTQAFKTRGPEFTTTTYDALRGLPQIPSSPSAR